MAIGWLIPSGGSWRSCNRVSPERVTPEHFAGNLATHPRYPQIPSAFETKGRRRGRCDQSDLRPLTSAELALRVRTEGSGLTVRAGSGACIQEALLGFCKEP